MINHWISRVPEMLAAEILGFGWFALSDKIITPQRPTLAHVPQYNGIFGGKTSKNGGLRQEFHHEISWLQLIELNPLRSWSA